MYKINKRRKEKRRLIKSTKRNGREKDGKAHRDRETKRDTHREEPW